MSLARMDRDTVAHYLIFRWSKAGAAGALPFTEDAIDGVAAWSKGIPRLINAICDNALLIAFSDETHAVEVQHIRDACCELDLPVPDLKPRLDQGFAAPLTRAVMPFPPESARPQVVQEPLRDPEFWMEKKPSRLARWFGREPNGR